VILATLALALTTEWVFATLFFLLQGSAVAATAKVKPRGGPAIPWVVGTFAFILLSSVLFFASWQGLGEFYAGGLPSWLLMW
jgi:hypothetical protein